MEFVIPASCDTPRAQALYAHRMMRFVEERHNDMGSQARTGTLPMREFVGWKSAVWTPGLSREGSAVNGISCGKARSNNISRL